MPEEQTYICPCCGTNTGKTLKVEYLLMLQLSSLELLLAQLMVKRYPNPIPLSILVDYAYSDDNDGGPEDAPNTIKVTLSRLRKKLAPSGWTVKSNEGGRGVTGEYRLEPLKTAA